MNTLHAVRRARQGLRLVQAKAVMPMIGPLLDCWEQFPNDEKDHLREVDPLLCRYLDQINEAMEGTPGIVDGDSF